MYSKAICMTRKSFVALCINFIFFISCDSRYNNALENNIDLKDSETSVIYYILQASYCKHQESIGKAENNKKVVKNLKHTIALKFGQREKFISIMNRTESVNNIRIYLKEHNFGNQIDLKNIFIPNIPTFKRSIGFNICNKDLRINIYRKIDTLNFKMSSYVTISKPIFLSKFTQLYYYEMGEKRNMMVAGFIILNNEKNGEIKPVDEKMLWIN